jgi:putative ABC transport system permease protein
MSLVVRSSGDPLALIEPVRRALAETDPGLPLGNPTTLDEVVAASLAGRTRFAALLSAFAGAALALAAIGLYAVTARSVGSRRREIGIRKAVGAETGTILRLVLAEEAPAVVIGLIVGIAASVPSARILGAMLYSTRAGDPLTIVAVCVTLTTAAAAALSIPAWRAARTPPAIAVRD